MDLSEHARMEITQECLPPNFQNEIVENGDIVTIRSNIKSMIELKEWVKEFGIRTNTKWNSRDSCPSGERFVCRKKFVCRRSAFMKVPSSENKKKNSKNAKCCASVSVKVKLNTPSTGRNDQFAKRGLVGVITIVPSHTHSLLPAEKSKRSQAKNCRLTSEKLSCDKNSASTSKLFLTTPRRSSRNRIQSEICKKKEDLSSDKSSSSTSKLFLTTPRHSLVNCVQAKMTPRHSSVNCVQAKMTPRQSSVNCVQVKMTPRHSSVNCVQAKMTKKKENPSSCKNSSSTSTLFLITPRHSSENNIQAYKNYRKKQLSEKLMELFGSGLERFEASEQALKTAVEHLKDISTKAQWDVMLETLGQTCFLKKEKG